MQLLLLVLLLLPAVGLAQPSLRGRVTDARTGEALTYARVVCYDDGKALHAITSDKAGGFQLLAGDKSEYRLVANRVGYTADTLRVSMPAYRTKEGEVIEVGELKLKPGVEIDAVTIEGQKPLFEQQNDRYIYNVAEDPDAKRLKMSEMMDKVPMLKIDAKGRLTYLGKDNVQLIVNGEQHELLNGGKQYVMNFLRADLMDQIEIIPPGSAQYNNDKPIINIKTLRRIPNGFAMEVTGGGNTDNVWTAGVDLVTKIRDKAIVGMSYTVNFTSRQAVHNTSLRETFSGNEMTDIQDNSSASSSDNLGHRLNLRGSTKLWGNNLNVGISTSFGESNSYSLSELLRTDGAGQPKESQTTQAHTANTTKPRVNFDVGYRLGLGEGYRLCYTYLYTNDVTALKSASTTEFSIIRPNQRHLTSNNSGAREHTANVLLLHTAANGKIKAHTAEGEVKYTDRHFANTSERLRWDPLVMEYVPDYTYDNGMNYTQRIASFKGFYKFYHKKVFLMAGVLATYENSRGVFHGKDAAPLHYERFMVLPYIAANTRICKRYSVSMKYNMNVVRPDFAMLSPYVDATDSMNLHVGNPGLQPERSQDIKGGIRGSVGEGSTHIMNLDLLYSRIDRAIEQLVEVDPASGISTTTYANVGRRNNLTVRLKYMGRLIPKWVSLLCEVAYNYVDYQSLYSTSRSGSQHAVAAKAMLLIGLWRSATINLSYDLLPDIGSPQRGGVNYTHTCGVGFSQTLIKNRLFLNLTLDNPFESRRYIPSSLVGTNFRSTSYAERRGRIFGFSLRANFGRFRDRVGEHADLTDDRSRAVLPEKNW